MNPLRRRLAACITAHAAFVVLVGCGSDGGAAGPSDPIAVLHDQEKTTTGRTKAVDDVWAGVEDGSIDRDLGRESLKKIVWSRGAPSPTRLRAMERLLSDQTESGATDSRRLTALLLPTETDWDLLSLLSSTCAERHWNEAAPALVRSLSRVVPEPADSERPEFRALESLFPGQPVVDTAFDVFLSAQIAESDPSSSAIQVAGISSADSATRTRNAAWDLLGRLDPDGTERSRLLASDADAAQTNGQIALLRAAASQLGVVPVTGAELSWLTQLRIDTAWWSEMSAAVALLGPEQRKGLQIRHLEPLRLAPTVRSAWLTASREQLLSELSTRLGARRTHIRTAEQSIGWTDDPQNLKKWGSSLSWGDLLTILVIDELLTTNGASSPHSTLAMALSEQVALDQADGGTEFGGVLTTVGNAASGRLPRSLADADPSTLVAICYPPRITERRRDREFVASIDMMDQSARSLAHYHFHVQSWRNEDYAGPGAGDREYARTQGRTCIVFTAIREGILNVDLYLRGGATIDLGEISVR